MSKKEQIEVLILELLKQINELHYDNVDDAKVKIMPLVEQTTDDIMMLYV